MPHHLRHADLAAHRDELTARRTVLTHMSAEHARHVGQPHTARTCHEAAHDGLVLRV